MICFISRDFCIAKDIVFSFFITYSILELLNTFKTKFWALLDFDLTFNADVNLMQQHWSSYKTNTKLLPINLLYNFYATLREYMELYCSVENVTMRPWIVHIWHSS